MENGNQTVSTTPGLDEAIRQKIVIQCSKQIKTSRDFKRARMSVIKENENLYYGIVEKSIRNPFNENFPLMSGYVDYYRSRVDDDSTLSFEHKAEADLKRATKIQSFYEMTSKSISVDDSWDLKHRLAKFNALLSGVAIYSYYSESAPVYRSCLEVISHYDFHCEPRGGSMLERHLFCGVDNIYKTPEELKGNTSYNQDQVTKLLEQYKNNGFKDTNNPDNSRNNRLQANNQDPQTHNFVGQETVKLAQFYTTYEGKRYYVLFNEDVQIGIRVCPIEEMFPSGLYPYVAWHTNEDADMFWSKAPADDARGPARIINLFLNQELYNRQKRNYGKIAYDVRAFPNIAALADWRPDGLIPMDLSTGAQMNNSIYELKVGDLNGTLDLVTFIDQFVGKQIGRTAAAAGQSEADKKVGIFQGEIEQIDQLINVKNRSYRYALSCLGLRFKKGLEENLKKPVAIQIMGADGVNWDTLSPEEVKTEQDLVIEPVGGSSEMRLQQLKDQKKSQALTLVQTVNPQWKDREMLILAGFTEEEAKEAFSTGSFAQKELLSEAAQAEKDIVEGKTPALNRGATAEFMQHIVDFATNAEGLSDDQYNALMKYAMDHQNIAIENGTRNISDMIRKKTMQQFNAPSAPGAPVPSSVPTSTPSQLPAPTPSL